MSHARQRAQSYRILENARQEAADKKHYASEQTRVDLATLFRERFGKDPYPWQLDVTEAILLGLDCVVIAGTGAGKTMPFMMPLLLDRNKSIIIISPLKVLQTDQVRRHTLLSNPHADKYLSERQSGLRRWGSRLPQSTEIHGTCN